MEQQNKYNRGKIYKLIGNEDNGLVYIGSTCEKYLSNRLSGHVEQYKRYQEGKNTTRVYSSYQLFEKYGIGSVNIILLEDYACGSKDQLRRREQYYIEQIDCVNKRPAYRADSGDKKGAYASYYQEKKEEIKANVKKYQQEHPEIKIQSDIKCRDARLKRRKETMIQCDVCKIDINRDHKSRHYRTKAHLAKI